VEGQCNNQLDKRHKRGVTRGDGAMRSGGAMQMGGSSMRRAMQQPAGGLEALEGHDKR
jgi:hypothetical protein